MRERHPEWRGARKPQAQNWLDFPSSIPGVRINPVFAQSNRIRMEVYIDTGDGDRNMEIFQTFLDHRERVEAIYGAPLEYEELAGRRACRIAEYSDGHVTETNRHQEFIEWFIDRSENMRRTVEMVAALLG